MAKRRKSRRKRSQLGYNADARQAMKHARAGKCELAMRHLVDASSEFYTNRTDKDDAHLARVIVNQHCGKARSRRVKAPGKKAQQFPYWGSAKRKRRKSRR